jgi:hypothetical protein
MLILKKIVCVVLVLPVKNWASDIHPRASFSLQGLWSFFTWISLDLQLMILSVEEDSGWSLLIIIHGIRGCFSSSPKMKLTWNSLSGPNKLSALMVKISRQ